MCATNLFSLAVVPPPPKHYTDEELKQQYGIQLATRLGADLPGGKDSKWADIDDEDEGDWVPESVQWVDGTKSILQPEEQVATAVSESVTVQVAQATDERPAEPIQIEIKPASTSGKTILRPGARLVPITKPGLVLKSLPEKPAQEEKPASTSTSKSPWAKLPAVEKASPISFEPPPPEPRQTYVSGDARESYRPERSSTSSPAREIEPDTFSRTWRESERGGNRELFNSQSGRYEPVKASRRLSRPESSLRPSSLLQRPSQGGADSISDDRAWKRKSVSSSRADGEALDVESDLKHHSGITPPQLHSSGENPDSDPLSSNKDHHTDNTAISGGQSIEKATAQSASQHESKSDPVAPTEDVRAVQQRLMQERIAAARKRKQEEEAKEEAAKQKRIAARLAALEAKTSSTPTKSEGAKESFTPTEAGSKAEVPPIAQEEPSSAKLAVFEPSALERREQIELPQKPSHTSPSTTPQISAQTSPTKLEPHVLQSPARTTLRSDTTAPLGFASPSRRRFNAPSLSKSLSDPAGLEITEEIQDLPGLGQLPEDRISNTTNTWQNVSLPQVSESSLGWAANMAKSRMHGGSVWGIESSDKPLGNGAFDRGVPHIQLPAQTNQTPAYLTETSDRVPSLSPGLSFDTGSNAAISPQPIGQRTPVYQQHTFQQQHNAIQQHHAIASVPQSQHQLPGYRANRPSPPIVQDQYRQNASRAWRDFGAAAERADADAREAARLDYLARMNEAPQRPVVNDYQPTYHETFKKTTPGDVLGQRRVVSVVQSVHEGDQPASIEVTPVQAPIGTPYASQQHHHIPVNLPMSNTRASSRFFSYGLGPHITHSTMPLESSSITPWSASSPPPPDFADHPVYGESRHPIVRLPTPAPVVKLPPQPVRMVPTEDTPVVMPPRSFRPGIQPIVANADWQQRFNGLFGRPDPSQALSPPSDSVPVFAPVAAALPTLPVDTSSKAALEVPAQNTPAVVSLPVVLVSSSTLRTGSSPEFLEVESKSMEAEEELWQDREFASLPIIRLPMANMWFHSDAATPFMQTGYGNPKVSKLQQLEMSKDFVSTVQPGSPLELLGNMTLGSVQIIVKLLNGEAQTVMMHAKPDTSGPPRRGGKKQKNKSFRDNTTTSQDISSSAPSGVENEKRLYKKSKRGSRGTGPASPSATVPNENVHSSHEGGLHSHGRPPRASRGGFKEARHELSTA